MKSLIESHFPLPEGCGRHLNLGIIGCGRMFRNCHAPALLYLKERGWSLDVKILCDPSTEAATQAGKLFPDAKIYSDYKTMPSPRECDAFLVQLWPPLGVEAARWLIGKRISFFIEKPVSHYTEELASLAAMAENAGVNAMVGYNRRFQAASDKFREIIAGMRGEKVFGSRFLRETRSEKIFYEDILGHPMDFMRSVLGELTIEAVHSWKPYVPGGILGGMKIAAVSDAGSCCFEVRPAVGQNLESYECLGHEESAKLVYHPLEKLAAPPELTWHRPEAKENFLTLTEQEQGDRHAILYCQGFVHQMANFLRLANGEDAGCYCSLRSAESTLRLILRTIELANAS